MDDKPLKEKIEEQLGTKGFSLERIAEITDIPLRYLEALMENNTKKLPAAPYVRGYLLKIGKILGLDGNELWETYKKESGVKISGPEDRLPSNRFAIKSLNKKYIIVATIVILLVGYLIWQAPRWLGQPPLSVSYPAEETTISHEAEITISGKIEPRDKLTINNEEILVDSEGNFNKNYSLQEDFNTIEIKAKRFLGRETKIIRQIIYQPENLDTGTGTEN